MRSNTLTSIRRALAAGAIAVSTLIAAVPASAQSLWTPVESGPSVHVELLRPDFAEGPIGFVGATAAGFVTGRAPIAQGWSAVADIPFSRAAWEDEEGVQASSNLLGNPYVGVEWSGGGRFGAELGARLPLGDTEDLEKLGAILIGIASELERMEAFTPETLGFYAGATYRLPLSGPLSLGLRGASAYLAGDGGPGDLLLGYASQLRYGGERGGVGAGVTGRVNVSSDSQTGGERFAHQVIVGGDRAFGRFRPTAQLRLHLDEDARDVSEVTLGLGLGYSFR